MKKHVLHLFFLSLLVYYPLYSTAQITISASDIGQFYTIGNTITERFDTLPKNYDIGMPGANNTWDFSVSGLQSLTQMVIDPNNTTAAESFPEANIAFEFDFEEEGVTGVSYNFLTLSDSELTFWGTYSFSQQAGTDYEQIIMNNPARRALALPLTFGSSWSYNGTQTISTNFDGSSFSQENNLDYTYEVDAYGSIIFPDGSNSQALRIKETQTIVTEVVPGFPMTTNSVDFVFLAQDGQVLALSAEAASPANQGTIQGTLSWSVADLSSSAQELLNQGFLISAIAPNPVQQNAQVSYHLPRATNIQLQLLDLHGRIVKILMQGRQAAGPHQLTFSVDQLPSGSYTLSLRTSKGALSQKILVQH